jgi:hypothetical protein
MKMIIPATNASKYIPELVRLARKIQGIVGDDREQNPELFTTTVEFLGFVQDSSAPPSKPPSPPTRATRSQTVPNPPTELIDPLPDQLTSPGILVYRWIADLASSDPHVAIQALKAISTQMKKGPSVLEKHIEALTVLLISQIHTQFAVEHPPIRFCKYVSVCLLTLFSESNLCEGVRKEFIQQIVYELLTHLSNGINETVLNQLLNAIIVKLMENCPMFAFMGFLSAVGEYQNYQSFSDKWIRLALKCFEASGARICELGNASDVVNTLVLVDRFFLQQDPTQIEAAPLGERIMSALSGFVHLVAQGFGDEVRKKENISRISQNSVVLQLLS